MKTKETTTVLLTYILAGMAIAIAALCNLKSTNPYIGAALFVFGLSTVVTMKWGLFTGRVGQFDSLGSFKLLFPILLLNVIGAGLVATIGNFMGTSVTESANRIVEARLSTPMEGIFFLSCLCGFIMTVSVIQANKKKWLPLITGIPLFVISSFPHCIADVTYYINSDYGFLDYYKVWLISILGNAVGGNIPSLYRFLIKNEIG